MGITQNLTQGVFVTADTMSNNLQSEYPNEVSLWGLGVHMLK